MDKKKNIFSKLLEVIEKNMEVFITLFTLIAALVGVLLNLYGVNYALIIALLGIITLDLIIIIVGYLKKHSMRTEKIELNVEKLIGSIFLMKSFDGYDGFEYAVKYALDRKEKIYSIDIFAQTTNTYYRDSISRLSLDIGNIKELRVIIPDDKILNEHKESTKNTTVDYIVAEWNKLTNKDSEQLIKNVNHKTCNYLPVIHFAIVNRKYLHFSIYKKPESITVKTNYRERFYKAYVIVNDDVLSRTLREDFQNFFDSYFN